MSLKKYCYKCCRVLPITEFCKDRHSKDGHHNRCNECGKIQAKRYYEKNKKRILQRQFISCHGHGLIYKKFLLASQGFKCSICGQLLEHDSSDACLDHNHKTGEIRGVLCRLCNAYLGKYNDNIIGVSKGIISNADNDTLRNAYDYLLQAF